MKKLAKSMILAFVLLIGGVGTAVADHDVGFGVPASLIVVDGGLDWAYANPCPPGGCPASNGIMGALPVGWALASAADWAASSWGSNAAVYAAFSGKCASSYFADSSGYDHCDFGDVSIYNAAFSPHDGFDETFVVRNAIPEPETYAMLLAGLGLLGFVARRRKQKLAAA